MFGTNDNKIISLDQRLFLFNLFAWPFHKYKQSGEKIYELKIKWQRYIASNERIKPAYTARYAACVKVLKLLVVIGGENKMAECRNLSGNKKIHNDT